MGDFVYIAIFLGVMFFLLRKLFSVRGAVSSEASYACVDKGSRSVHRKMGRFGASKFEYALNAEILNTYHVMHRDLQATNDCEVCDA